MGRRVRLPWIVDLLLVDDPAEIRELAPEPRLDRRFDVTGPLVNRVLAHRIRSQMQVAGTRLPALAPRGDRRRAGRQEELEKRLGAVSGKPLWEQIHVVALASYVRGRLDDGQMGPVVQEICGRLFDAGYRASAESWRAAVLFDRASDADPLRRLFWTVTGRLRRAHTLLAALAKDDEDTFHATAIALHNIVRSLQRMRTLQRDPGARARLSEATIVTQCLVAPRRVPRQVTGELFSRAAAGSLRPGTFVLMQLDEARERAPGPEITFMSEQWSRCPARAFVPALLLAVWRASEEMKP
jgi:hypothetical protein